jgi:hypothetical protein
MPAALRKAVGKAAAQGDDNDKRGHARLCFFSAGKARVPGGGQAVLDVLRRVKSLFVELLAHDAAEAGAVAHAAAHATAVALVRATRAVLDAPAGEPVDEKLLDYKAWRDAAVALASGLATSLPSELGEAVGAAASGGGVDRKGYAWLSFFYADNAAHVPGGGQAALGVLWRVKYLLVQLLAHEAGACGAAAHADAVKLVRAARAVLDAQADAPVDEKLLDCKAWRDAAVALASGPAASLPPELGEAVGAAASGGGADTGKGYAWLNFFTAGEAYVPGGGQAALGVLWRVKYLLVQLRARNA